MPDPKHVGQYTEVEWTAEVKRAKQIWSQFRKKAQRGQWETSDCPMSPRRFYEQCNADGFCQSRGWTYAEYVQQWKQPPLTRMNPPSAPIKTTIKRKQTKEHLTLIRRNQSTAW